MVIVIGVVVVGVLVQILCIVLGDRHAHALAKAAHIQQSPWAVNPVAPAHAPTKAAALASPPSLQAHGERRRVLEQLTCGGSSVMGVLGS